MNCKIPINIERAKMHDVDLEKMEINVYPVGRPEREKTLKITEYTCINGEKILQDDGWIKKITEILENETHIKIGGIFLGWEEAKESFEAICIKTF